METCAARRKSFERTVRLMELSETFLRKPVLLSILHPSVMRFSEMQSYKGVLSGTAGPQSYRYLLHF